MKQIDKEAIDIVALINIFKSKNLHSPKDMARSLAKFFPYSENTILQNLKHFVDSGIIIHISKGVYCYRQTPIYYKRVIAVRQRINNRFKAYHKNRK